MNSSNQTTSLATLRNKLKQMGQSSETIDNLSDEQVAEIIKILEESNDET